MKVYPVVDRRDGLHVAIFRNKMDADEHRKDCNVVHQESTGTKTRPFFVDERTLFFGQPPRRGYNE